MTRRTALDVLIRAASERARGAGTGIASIASPFEKRLIRDAVERLYPEAYGRKPYGSDLSNLGLPPAECETSLPHSDPPG